MLSFNWKHIALILFDVAIAVYLVLAITVFNQPEDKAQVCTEVNINIVDGQTRGLLSPAGIKQLLQKQRQYPLAQPMQFVSTRQIEETLLKNPFIAKAECYKTQNGHVAIELQQRNPVLHVMATSGEQYYIDDEGVILPPSRYGGNLLVVTGVLTQKYALNNLLPVALHLSDNRFWQEQIEQLHVLADGTLEMVPRVGDHVVYFGPPTNIPQKLERLKKFYKYGLSHVGWNRYQRINVEFDNQIICKKAQLGNKS